MNPKRYLDSLPLDDLLTPLSYREWIDYWYQFYCRSIDKHCKNSEVPCPKSPLDAYWFEHTDPNRVRGLHCIYCKRRLNV